MLKHVMTARRNGVLNRCKVCMLNPEHCVCDAIKPINIKTNVSLIVHVRELKLPSNTAQFAKLMLPQNAEIDIRGRIGEQFSAASILERSGRPIFLYPHDDAFELNDDFKEKFPGPYHLIIPDGNWQQARKVRKREVGLKDLPAVKLPQGIRSEYQLRKAIQPEWVSTYEAMAHALGILEGPEVRDDLMAFFRHWVKTSLYNRTGLEKYK